MLGGIEMSVTNEFRKAVAEKNVDMIHIMMSKSMLFDPTFEEFNEMEKLAKDVPGLYVKHDNNPLIDDVSKWDNDYLYRLDAELVFNFSHERVDHIKKITRYLQHKQSIEKPEENNQYKDKHNQKKLSYEEQKRQDQQEGRITKIVFGAVAGGVAGGVISGVAGGSVIAGAVVGAVVVGGVVALATK